MNKIQKLVEEHVAFLIVFVLLVISVGLLVEVIPLFFSKSVTQPLVYKDENGDDAVYQPYNPLQLAGRDIYIREGCYNCHSQMIRPFRAETERYGHYSVGGESVYDHPFQWGSKRTGPDLAREGGIRSDTWHKLHFNDPRQTSPGSNMPSFAWLEKKKIDPNDVVASMKALSMVGVPYTKAQMAEVIPAFTVDPLANPAADDGVERTYQPGAYYNSTEMDALIAYMQGLGLALKNVR